jgi:type III secretory pathway component EscV
MIGDTLRLFLRLFLFIHLPSSFLLHSAPEHEDKRLCYKEEGITTLTKKLNKERRGIKQMAKVDMTGIRSSIIAIFSMLRKQQDKVTAYHEEYEAIKFNKDFSEEGKKKKISDLTAKLKEATAKNFRNLEAKIDTILADGKANEAVFNIENTKLQGAIQLINSLGRSMDLQTIEDVIRPFIGEQKALKTIKTLFEANKIGTDEIEKYIFSIENYVEAIQGKIYFIVTYPDLSKGNAKSITDALSDLADACGIELSEDETLISADGNYYGM